MGQNPPPIQTEPLNGLPSWPIGLLAGVEGSGKTAESIIASSSELIGRTFMIVVGEDTPHDYAAIPGQRVEVVKHDGTYRGILNAVEAARLQPRVEPDKPNLILLDSATRLWNLLSDSAQESANTRAKKKNKYVGEDGADIGRDLWNVATTRFYYVIEELRLHDGPSLITARLDLQSGTDEKTGQPTKEKVWKVQAQKGLPFEVGFIVHMRAPYPERDNYLAKVKKWGFAHKTDRDGNPVFTALDDDFSVEWLWLKLGLDKLVQKRDHATMVVQTESDQTIHRDDLLAEVKAAAEAAQVSLQTIADDWANSHNGQHIAQTTDLGGLELLIDDLRAQSNQGGLIVIDPDVVVHAQDPRVAEKIAEVQAQVDAAPPVVRGEDGAPEPSDRAGRAPRAERNEAERVARVEAEQAARASSAPTNETRDEKMLRLAREELVQQAKWLGLTFEHHAAPVLTKTGELKKSVLVKYIVAQRTVVIERLREVGDSTVAEAYERIKDGFPVLIKEIANPPEQDQPLPVNA